MPTIRVRVAAGANIPVSTTGAYRIIADDRVVTEAAAPLPEGRLSRNGRVWTLGQAAHSAGRLVVLGVGASRVRIGSTSYRGGIVFSPDPQDGVVAVNHLDIESYLAGVLRRELYPGWSLTTYRAQAIAARTYALYEKATLGRGRAYDVRDDHFSQVYGGASAETDKAWRAVRETRGVVLAAGAKGKERIFRAHYSSCCGGVTNNVGVLYDPWVAGGPLAGGVVCEDCAPSPRRRWAAVSVRKDVIHRALRRHFDIEDLGSLEAIEVAERRAWRPVWVTLVGGNGKRVRIRAENVRLALLRAHVPEARGLYSMNCRIRDAGEAVVFDQGRGFGHGVGLCQWGAEGKARRGMTAEQIVLSYYPQARLFKMYD